jgi:hypothetical protein
VFVVTARRVFNHMKIIDLGTCKTEFSFFCPLRLADPLAPESSTGRWRVTVGDCDRRLRSTSSRREGNDRKPRDPVSVAILRPTRTGSIPHQTYYPGPTGLQFQPQALPPRSGRD